MKKPPFITGEIYHIYNRGVEKRDIFLEEEDYYRIVDDFYELNDKNTVRNIFFRYHQNPNHLAEGLKKIGDKLIEILCFCLMPNHFHLILRQLKENGIPLFMQKLGIGYVNYFNLKYQRVGPLFQGRYEAIHVDKKEYFLHLTRYIHLNCLDLIQPDWKEKGIKDWKKANKFLKSYRWSSYLDHIGKKNFPSVINKDFLNQFFKNPKDYERFVKEWMIKDLSKIEDLILEK